MSSKPNIDVAVSGNTIIGIEKIPYIEKSLDDQGKCPTDMTEEAELTRSKEKMGGISQISGELGYSLVSSDGVSNVISAIFTRNYMKYLENLINRDLYIFNQECSLKIKETPSQDLYERLKSISKIHVIRNRTFVCEIDENYVIFYLNGITSSNQIEYIINSKTPEAINSINKKIENLFHDLSSTEERYLYISWYYNTPDGYRYITINDKLYDTFHKEAYPYLDIDKISKNYMERDEPIMVLLGPPGTGKTRLIRCILNNFCNQRNNNINVMVTSDQQIIEQGNLFINFIGSDDQDVLVLEDIDYHLTARKDGNTAMYNFLSISNGLAIGHQKDKKIILSTNLPNVKNIDPALLRPGRCFGILETRLLYYDESQELLKKLNITEELNPKKEYSLAELYNIDKQYEGCLSNKKSTGFL